MIGERAELVSAGEKQRREIFPGVGKCAGDGDLEWSGSSHVKIILHAATK